jgi:hypothetical protein
MVYRESDRERIRQAEELSARLNGIKIIHKTVKPKINKPNKWNKESEESLKKISAKYRKIVL